MGNYNAQYTNYYEGLKRKAGGNTNVAYSGFEDYLTNNLGYRDTKKKSKNNNLLVSIINVFIFQTVVSLILLLIVFGAKYSNDKKVTSYYESVKTSMNQEFNYSNFENTVETFKATDIVKQVQVSLEKVKTLMKDNSLEY